MILFDLDDFCNDERSLHDLAILEDVRRQVPTLKVTLFTIPGRCDVGFLHNIRENYPYIDLVQHGWMHASNYECLTWDEQTCRQRLRDAREMGFTTKGFKAPGWQISDACYRVLLEEGYWVADQPYNDVRRPKDLPVYRLRAGGVDYVDQHGKLFWQGGETDLRRSINSVRQIHGHIGHLGGHNDNALELILPDLMKAVRCDSDFRFIREVME